jgi:phosphate transport system permease protein
VTIAISRGATRSRAHIAGDAVFALLLFVGTLVGIVFLGLLVVEIFSSGWARLASDPVAFVTSYVSRFPTRAGVKAAVYGSAWLMALTFAFSFPVGVGCALYLEEFAPKNKLTNLIDANISNLAGVPSVVYGILGLGVFVRFAGWGPTVLAGGMTLSLMTLPVIIIASREAIRAVPSGIRHGALALGATPWQAVSRQVLPVSIPGIMTGTILALSRAIGETAPLLVIGAAVSIFTTPRGLDDRFSALPLVIFNWTQRPKAEFAQAAAAAIIVLLAMLMAMNAVAIFLRNRYSTRW